MHSCTVITDNHTNSDEVKVAAATRQVCNVLEDSGVQPEETVTIHEAQLQDGIIGPILTSKEANKQPDKAGLTGERRISYSKNGISCLLGKESCLEKSKNNEKTKYTCN